MSLDGIRDAIDEAPGVETAAFVRRVRNAIAQAVLAEALAHEQPAPPRHAPPEDALTEHVGPELAAELVAVYSGGADWTTHAIDALEPLHELTRAGA
jgi:hypothetical protein